MASSVAPVRVGAQPETTAATVNASGIRRSLVAAWRTQMIWLIEASAEATLITGPL
jgi:hypothetical protein